MTTGDGAERRLSEWLAAAADVRAPARILLAAEARASTTRQVSRPIPRLGDLLGPAGWRPARQRLAGFTAAVIVVVIGAGAIYYGSVSNAGVAENPVAWRSDVVSLQAADMAITADGRHFVGHDPVALHSDPGNLRYWTLEAAWHEGGAEMRLNIYFAADDRDWWATEIRTYDGREPADWITYMGTFFRRPLGQPYTGDLDISTNRPLPGRLTFARLRIEVHPRQGDTPQVTGADGLTRDTGHIHGPPESAP